MFKFRKKKLYKIRYTYISSGCVIIDAVDEIHTIRKFNKMAGLEYSVESIEEYKIN